VRRLTRRLGQRHRDHPLDGRCRPRFLPERLKSEASDA
jgi:hypothetical protein